MTMDTATVLMSAYDLINEYISMEIFSFEAVDQHLASLGMLEKQRLTIITRLANLHLQRQKEAYNIAKAIMVARWEQQGLGQEDDPRQENLFSDDKGWQEGIDSAGFGDDGE